MSFGRLFRSVSVSENSVVRPMRRPNSIHAIKQKEETKTNESIGTVNALIVGSGDSGKSTLFKQIKKIYGIDEEKRDINFSECIYFCIMETMKALVASMEDHREMDRRDNLQIRDESNLKNCDKIAAVDVHPGNSGKLYPEFAEICEKLWEEEVIKAQLPRRFDYHVFDGAPYFFTDQGLGRFRPIYHPTFEDTLYCRRKTTGVLDLHFEKNSLKFTMEDVGGQRSERRKWKQRFENTDVLVFVISVSEFDQMMYEDHNVNRMHESLDLFEATINHSIMIDKPVFVLFNKIDILREKLQYKSINIAFPEYKGSQDFDETCRFIQERYLNVNKGDPTRISWYFMSVLNETSVRKFMDEFVTFMTNKKKKRFL